MAAKIQITDRDALIVVDVQNDFCPGGALAVPEGDRVVPVLNRLLPKFATRVFTRDWHPADHCSFAKNPTFRDRSWPPHCVQNTPGAAFHPGLVVPPDAIIVSKGQDPQVEAYSGFQGTGLSDRLRQKNIERVFVGGLATDYCVKATVLDAMAAGFAAALIPDAARGVNIPPGTGDQAVAAMTAAGARIVSPREIEGSAEN